MPGPRRAGQGKDVVVQLEPPAGGKAALDHPASRAGSRRLFVAEHTVLVAGEGFDGFVDIPCRHDPHHDLRHEDDFSSCFAGF